MYEAWPRQRSLRVAFERRDKIGFGSLMNETHDVSCV